MEAHIQIALEAVRQVLPELRLSEQAGDFKLVLMRQKTEILRRGGAKYLFARSGLFQCNQLLAVKFAKATALIVLQAVHPVLNQLFQWQWSIQLHHLCNRCPCFGNALRIQHHQAAPVEGLEVLVAGNTIQLDGLTDGTERHRYEAALPGGAKQRHVRHHRIPAEIFRGLCGVEVGQPVANCLLQPRLQVGGVDVPVRVLGKVDGRHFFCVHHHLSGTLAQGCQRFITCCHHQVAADHHIRFANRQSCTLQAISGFSDTHVCHHRTILLREARQVQRGNTAAIQMRGHGKDRANGDNARAANARHQQASGTFNHRQVWLCQYLITYALHLTLHRCGRLLRLRAVNGYEAGAEPLNAGEILVAAGLVDLPFAAQRRFQRLDGKTARLLTAITAAFTNVRVDVGADLRIFPLATFAQAAAFCGAGLIINQHRYALYLAQIPLHRFQLSSVVHLNTRRNGLGFHPLHILCHHNHLPHALIERGGDQLRHGLLAINGLPAGHRNKAVDQQFIGHGCVGSHRLSHGQKTGVEVGAIAHVGEHVRFIGKWRLSHPVHALTAHLGGSLGLHRVIEIRNGVAANTRQCAAAIGHLGGGVVRATGAE